MNTDVRPTDTSPSSNALSIDVATANLVDHFQQVLETTLRRVLSEHTYLAQSSVDQQTSLSNGTELRPQDRLEAADLRTALLLGKIPENTGIMIDTKTFARLLSISPRHVTRLHDLKALPEPVHLGRLIRWPLAEILAWIDADCPPQHEWSIRRREPPRRRGK